MDEFVRASDYDAAVLELDAALALIATLEARFISRGFCRGKHGPKPDERRVTVKTRLAPLDLPKGAEARHPL